VGLTPICIWKYAVMFEGVLGYLFLALFIVVLVRKLVRWGLMRAFLQSSQPQDELQLAGAKFKSLRCHNATVFQVLTQVLVRSLPG